jgi:hypothetical protein
MEPGNAWRVAYLAAALVCAVPFAYGLGVGGSFYFRDISGYFFPLRSFVVDGLLGGEIRQWNPYVSEGVPVLAVSYPLDLLQLLLPNPWGFSVLLALHVPLAALTFVGLARQLGWEPGPAALGAIVYALSGFSLSALNLYLHLQALAWAPLVVGTLVAASRGGRREVAIASLASALCLSTLGVEIAAQAVIFGWVLAASRRVAPLLRLAASSALGLGLAAAPMIALGDMVSGSRRGVGFSIAAALDYSVHPVSLLQIVIARLHGDPMSFGTDYWGSLWHGGSYPYFVSLYLGGAVVCLVVVASTGRDRYRTRLLLLLLAGAVVCLGRWSRLDLLLEIVPMLSKFRFPVKAFFTVLLAASLLASAAAQRLSTAPSRVWRNLAFGATLLGSVLFALRFVEPLLPAAFAWLERSFFDPAYPLALRANALRAISTDAGLGSLSVLAIAGVAGLRLHERISAGWGIVVISGLIAADLLRAGAGLNPTADGDLYRLSPEMRRESARMRESGGRILTCTVQASPTYREQFRQRPGRIGLWTYVVLRETLTPYANLDVAVPAVGRDPTGLVPLGRSLSADEEMCRAKGTLEKVRRMGVKHVIALYPILADGLRLVAVVSPARIAPLSIYLHEVEDGLADPAVSLSPDDLDERGAANLVEGARARYVDESAGRIRVAVQSPRDAYLVVRRAQAAGWSATVDGASAEIEVANGRHQAVRVPAGATQVEFCYRAPHGRLGAGLSGVAALLASALWIAGGQRRR